MCESDFTYVVVPFTNKGELLEAHATSNDAVEFRSSLANVSIDHMGLLLANISQWGSEVII